jgi:hypothetical protein
LIPTNWLASNVVEQPWENASENQGNIQHNRYALNPTNASALQENNMTVINFHKQLKIGYDITIY